MKREEIVYAKKVLRTMHPLYNLKIELCLPFVDPIIGCSRRCLQNYGYLAPDKKVSAEERQGLAGPDGLKTSDGGLTKKDLEMAGEEESEPEFDFALDEDEDPIGRLGYGVVSYFSLIYTMMIIFGIIALVHLPVMQSYSQWNAYASERQLSWTAQYTIGNLGQSMPRCATVDMVSDKLDIGCNTGYITEIKHFGFFKDDSEADKRSLCAKDTTIDTGLQCDTMSDDFEHGLYTQLLKTCIGKKACPL